MKICTSIFLGLFFLFGVPAQATHNMGGEISYRCLGQGRYEFTVVVNRDCGGITAPFNVNAITLRGPHGNTTLPLVLAVDLSPRCASSSVLVCDPPSTGSGIAGSRSEFTYKGVVNLSALPPAPVTTGYSFWVNFPCCRTSAANSTSSNGTIALEAKLYRFTDPLTGQAMSPAEICDVSPRFLLDQSQVFLNNPNDTIYLQHSGYDLDLEDSLVYSIVPPLTEQRTPYAFTQPYSISNPIPGLLGNNSPINSKTGEVVFKPNTIGSFVLPVQIKTYRQGQLISEVTREQLLRIVSYGNNTPAPIPSGSTIGFLQRAPQIMMPEAASSDKKGFDWEFYAGDTVQLALRATDAYPLFKGNPLDPPSTWVFANNDLRMAVNGTMVSNNHLTATGCLTPPCATLRSLLDPLFPAPVANVPTTIHLGNGRAIGGGYANHFEVGTILTWPTTCASLPQNDQVKAVDFQVRITAIDSACEIEGRNDATLNLRLHRLPSIPAPTLLQLVFDSISLTYALKFSSNFDSSSIDPLDSINYGNQSRAAQKARSINRRLASFQSYRIYRSTNAQGPWILVGATVNPFDTMFLDTTMFTGSHQVFYRIAAISGCGANESISNGLHAVFNSTSVYDGSPWNEYIQLMPNPGRDVYRLKAVEGHFLPNKWELRDMQGRLLQAYEIPDDQTQFELNLQAQSQGVYLLYAKEAGKAFRLVHRP